MLIVGNHYLLADAENNNEGGEGTESHVGDIKKRRQFIYPRFCF